VTVSEESIVLKNWKGPFFTVWIGQAFSLLGSQLVQFALVWYLTKQTGSAVILTTATLVALLPQVFLAPIAGSIVDRGNRRVIMMVSDSAVALLTLVLAALFALGVVQIWHIYVLLFLRSLGGAFQQPALSASTSLMVPKQNLGRVQGLNQTLQNGLSVFSAPLGALMLVLLPMQGILALDIVTAIIAVGILFFIAIPQPARVETPAGTVKPNVWQDMRAGFRYVSGWPGLLIVLLMATLINFLLTPASSLSPLLIIKHFGGGAQELGWFDAAFGLGAIGGGVLLGIWGGFKKQIITAMAALVGLGVGIGAVGLVPANAFPLLLVTALLAGLMIPIVNGSLGAVMQATVEPAMQGRVFSLTGAVATAMSPIGLIVAGPLADTLGVQSWYLAGGIACIVMGLLAFALPAVMSLEAGRPERKASPAASVN
jgi:DHA3 family macrolide efflux protein-like MFS transporter